MANYAAAILVKIKIGDVVACNDVRNRAIVSQQKTNRPVQFELTADVRSTLIAWLARRGGSTSDYLFPSRVDRHGKMSTRQYARLVDEWVTAIGLRKSEYGTHSLSRTKAAMIYRETGSIRAIQILLGHTKVENTVRYPGVDVEDALLLAERTEIWVILRSTGNAGRPLSWRELREVIGYCGVKSGTLQNVFRSA